MLCIDSYLIYKDEVFLPSFRVPSGFRVSQVLNDLIGCQLVASDWSDCTVQTVYTELVRALSTVHVYTQRGNIFGMSVDIAVVNTAIKVM